MARRLLFLRFVFCTIIFHFLIYPMKKTLLLFLFAFFAANVWAQTVVTHGPFVGAVTPTSARVFVRTANPAALTLEVSLSENFTSPLAFSGATQAGNDNTVIIDVSGLTPETQYYYRFTGVTGAETQRFKTFPTEGAVRNFTFAFGSCQKPATLPPNEPIFTKVQAVNPAFFLQCGDWGYPDTTEHYPQDSNYFSYDPQRIIDSYHARYSGVQMRELMKTTPMAYVYDDHDYVNNNASKTSSSDYNNHFVEIGFPPFVRQNTIDAYQKFFPHYPLVDAQHGVHQSIKYGNVEIFFLDNRASRSPNTESLQPSGNFYAFNPPPGHTILGAEQMQWLLNGLKNSTATWKFLVGGVSFNKGYSKAINEITTNTQLQELASNPFIAQQIPEGGLPGLLGSVVDTWAGFPTDQNAILNTLSENNIKNVVFLSSDSHTSAIDDGANAGIPELMAGNLAITNSRVASLMANIQNTPIVGNVITQDLNIWNRGGQGFGNQDFEHAYGKIDVFGEDSIRLSIVDVNDVIITSLTLCKDGIQPCGTTGVDKYNFGKFLELFPNPATQKITLQLNNAQYLVGQTKGFIVDITGRKLKTFDLKLDAQNRLNLSIDDLSAGLYYVVVASPKGNLMKSFRKQ